MASDINKDVNINYERVIAVLEEKIRDKNNQIDWLKKTMMFTEMNEYVSLKYLLNLGYKTRKLHIARAVSAFD